MPIPLNAATDSEGIRPAIRLEVASCSGPFRRHRVEAKRLGRTRWSDTSKVRALLDFSLIYGVFVRLHHHHGFLS